MEDLFLTETMGVEAKCILDENDDYTPDFVGMTESAEYALISKNRNREWWRASVPYKKQSRKRNSI